MEGNNLNIEVTTSENILSLGVDPNIIDLNVTLEDTSNVLELDLSLEPTDLVIDLTVAEGLRGPQGIQGPQGEVSDSTAIYETPAGLVNGINNIFTLSETPLNQSVEFSVNGILRPNYTIVDKTVTLDFAPSTGSIITANYFKTLSLLNIVVADIADLGTAATKDIEDFLPRELNPQFTVSTSQIVFYCNNDIQYDNSVGSAANVPLLLSNFPEISCEKLLIVNNARVSSFNMTLPSDFIDGDVNYKVVKLIESPLFVPLNGSVELSMLFIKFDANNYEIRITGGTSV